MMKPVKDFVAEQKPKLKVRAEDKTTNLDSIEFDSKFLKF